MKILHVISSFSLGGVEKFVRQLAEEQSKEHSVYILALAKSDSKEYEEKAINNLELKDIKTKILNKKKCGSRLSILKHIRKNIQLINPEIVNTHNEEVTFHTVNSLLGLSYNIYEITHSRICNYPIIQRFYLKFFVRKIIAISTDTKDNFKKYAKINDEKLILIQNGIKLDKFMYKDRKIKKSVNKIIAIGRLSVEKNHELLVEAFKLVKYELNTNEIEIPKIDIIGDGEEKENIKKLIDEYKLNDYITLCGEKSNIEKLLKDSDIYVLPSLTEGLSISLIEALASRIPIIATNVGGNSDIIKQKFNGLLCENNNSEDLAAKLLEYIKSYNLRKNMSDNSKIYINDFNIVECNKKYINMYYNDIKNSKYNKVKK